ncbi:hypothetical protein [Streptomyces sp. NPDC006477]|uniref:hypothetical protein n=1 Tax=Streptomyces sp. NPDC006477 TaxID=3364747 RepID=UPI0036CB4DEB
MSAALREMMNESLKDDLIVTPLYEEWLDRNPDGTIDPDVAANMAALMSTPDRVRSGSFSASQAGYCLRRQELAYLGVRTPGVIAPRLKRIFNNGKWVHLRWQAQLLTAGIIDSAEATVKKPSLRARATLDGMGIAQVGRYKGYDFGLEIKGRNDYTYSDQVKNDPDEKTRRQVDFQFLLSGFDVKVILNENKNNQEFHEWVFYRDEERVADARQELEDLNRAIDRGRLHSMLPECKISTGEFNTCPFGGQGGPCQMSGSWPTRL